MYVNDLQYWRTQTLKCCFQGICAHCAQPHVSSFFYVQENNPKKTFKTKKAGKCISPALFVFI